MPPSRTGLRLLVASSALALPLTLAAPASAQLTVRWSTVDAGGGRTASTPPTPLTLASAIAQPDASTLSGGAFTLRGGFLPARRQSPPCPADFNGDGVLDPDDLSDYIACFFNLPPCDQGDINADGFIDPDDLSDYIGQFFAGC